MQFKKKTSLGMSGSILKTFVKLTAIIGLFFLAVFLVDKIEFPYPKKDIKQVVPNENFKIIK